MGCTLRGERPEARRRTATEDEITYERVFVVLSDSDHVGQKEVSFCPGLPFLGYQYFTETEVDLLVRCVSREAAPVGNHRRLWEVTVRYSSKHDDPEKENNEEESVELEPPEVSYDFATRMKAVQIAAHVYDPNGTLLANPFGGPTTSAGEPFDPPPEMEEHYPVLTVTRNELFLNTNQIREYVNTVNSDVFQGGPARTVKCAGISARKQYKKNLRYWRTTYTLEYNARTWDLQLLDIGSYYVTINADGPNDKNYFLTDDEPAQPRLGLLNGFGSPLDDGATPQFRRFPDVLEAKPFAALQLAGALNF